MSVPSVVKSEQQDLTSVKKLAEVISVAVSEVSVVDKVAEQASALAAVSVALVVVAKASAAPAQEASAAPTQEIASKMAIRVATSEEATTAASPSGEKFKTCLLLVELNSPD